MKKKTETPFIISSFYYVFFLPTIPLLSKTQHLAWLPLAFSFWYHEMFVFPTNLMDPIGYVFLSLRSKVMYLRETPSNNIYFLYLYFTIFFVVRQCSYKVRILIILKMMIVPHMMKRLKTIHDLLLFNKKKMHFIPLYWISKHDMWCVDNFSMFIEWWSNLRFVKKIFIDVQIYCCY